MTALLLLSAPLVLLGIRRARPLATSSITRITSRSSRRCENGGN